MAGAANAVSTLAPARVAARATQAILRLALHVSQ